MKKNRFLSFAFGLAAAAGMTQGCTRLQAARATPALMPLAESSQLASTDEKPAKKNYDPSAGLEECFEATAGTLAAKGIEMVDIGVVGLDRQGKPFLEFTAHGFTEYYAGRANCDNEVKPNIRLYNPSKYLDI